MRKSKSSLFLMELIIVIFFFALTSAVCLQVFVKAHETSRDTKNINYAVLWADNASELFYEYGTDTDSIVETVNESFDLGNDYNIDLSFSEDSDYIYMDYSFYYVPTSETVYSYTFKQHIRKGAGHE